jgi:hypothetical protein
VRTIFSSLVVFLQRDVLNRNVEASTFTVESFAAALEGGVD